MVALYKRAVNSVALYSLHFDQPTYYSLNMQFKSSFLTLLASVSVVVSSAIPDNFCAPTSRVLVNTSKVTSAGHEITVATHACSAATHAARDIERRAVYNICGVGMVGPTCTTAFGTVAPVYADCQALNSAIAALGAGATFTVSPGYVQTFTYNTCQYGFVNYNSASGPTVSDCDNGFAGVASSIDINCIVHGSPPSPGGYMTTSPGTVYTPATALNYYIYAAHS
ncbi:hypothetical protein CPB83DRAFT_850453 [Crepidotus variabilis]|uniref:Uncharacterized protein n=1 Tax=Crepidotus variabilis TaxID=179855 RepID=A0A9P6EK13_9AGAR|nr:hypothetical protein CPB83DRAFT_850453 [Crepidotus variabilis]